VLGNRETRGNLISSIFIEPESQERHIRHLQSKYHRAERESVRFEAVQTEDADIILVGYGIVARILKSVVARARERGIRAGLLRPITLFPFPTRAIRALCNDASVFGVVEMSTGQMLEDVRLAVEGRRPVEFYGRAGGVVPTAEEILEFVRDITKPVWPDSILDEVAIHD
jgi:pyruvate/2-oxoacid:ferredoxin oxidoreductase alpha subunit